MTRKIIIKFHQEILRYTLDENFGETLLERLKFITPKFW